MVRTLDVADLQAVQGGLFGALIEAVKDAMVKDPPLDYYKVELKDVLVSS